MRTKLIAILGDISAFLTVLAAIPYELGEAAQYLSPNAKAWIAGVGVFSTLVIRIIGRILSPNQDAK